MAFRHKTQFRLQQRSAFVVLDCITFLKERHCASFCELPLSCRIENGEPSRLTVAAESNNGEADEEQAFKAQESRLKHNWMKSWKTARSSPS